MTLPRMPWRTFAVTVAAISMALPAIASPYRVTIDTVPLLSQAGYMAFDFVAGSPATGNAAVVSSFASNATLGSASSSGGASGSLSAGPLTLGGGPFFSEWLQGVVAFGSSIVFDIELGAAVSPGGVPDEFSFFLLDANQLPFATADPTGAGALFYFDLTGTSTAPVIFASDFASVTIEPLVVGNVPEPATLLLLLAGLAVVLRLSRAGQRRPTVLPAAPC